MNFLAHFYLAEITDTSIIGNFLGDFVKGPVDRQFTKDIRQGIIMHRKVDAFTEQHPHFIRCKQLISQERRRFSGIIIDLCFDHFLARNWDRYSSESLCDFNKRVYTVLINSNGLFPERLQYFVEKMATEDWLSSYKTIKGIGKIMSRVSNRLRVKNNLAGAVEELTNNYEPLESGFFLFFSDIKSYVKTL